MRSGVHYFTAGTESSTYLTGRPERLLRAYLTTRSLPYVAYEEGRDVSQSLARVPLILIRNSSGTLTPLVFNS